MPDPIITRRRVRCGAQVNAPFVTTPLQDFNHKQNIETVQGNATRFEWIFLTMGGEAVYDLSLVESLTMVIKPSQDNETTLATKTLAAADLDLTVDLDSYLDASKSHAVFLFSNGEMNLTMSQSRSVFWVTVTAILSTGEENTLAAGNLIFHRDNNGTTDLPPENPGTPITIEQADARYVAIDDAPPPLMLADDPIRPATATITVTGNNTDSWSVTSPGVPDVGASSSSYGGDVAKAAYIANAINGEPLFPFLAWANTNVITLEAKASGQNGNGIGFGALGTGLVTSGPSLQGGHTEEAFVIGQSAIVEYIGGGSSEWVAIDTGSASNWMRRTATKASVGLDKVDNTSDLAKPVSTITQAALNLKGNLTGGNNWNGTNSFQGNTPIVLKNAGGVTWGTFDSITGTLFIAKIETSGSAYLGGIINLAGTVSSSIYPSSNNTYHIGNTTNRFGNAWFAGTVTMANAAISGTVSGNHSYSGQLEATGQSASNGTSLITRDLGDARWFDPYTAVPSHAVRTTQSHWGSAPMGIMPFLGNRPDTNAAVSNYASSPPDVAFVPFFIRSAVTINTARIRVAGGTHATETVRGAIYSSDVFGLPLTRVGSAWNWNVSATGDRNAATGGITLAPGLYWVALQNSVGATLWGGSLTVLCYSSGAAGVLGPTLGLTTTSGASGFDLYNMVSYPFAAGWTSMPSSIAAAGGTSLTTGNKPIPAVLLY